MRPALVITLLSRKEGFLLMHGVLSGKIAAAVIWLILCFPFARAQNFNDIKPSPQQVEWQDLEFGVLIHFGTNTYLDREWGTARRARRYSIRRNSIPSSR